MGGERWECFCGKIRVTGPRMIVMKDGKKHGPDDCQCPDCRHMLIQHGPVGCMSKRFPRDIDPSIFYAHCSCQHTVERPNPFSVKAFFFNNLAVRA